MTLRELLQLVDAEAYASVPLYEELLKIVRESERKLQFSDDAIEIWKYLYRR